MKLFILWSVRLYLWMYECLSDLRYISTLKKVYGIQYSRFIWNFHIRCSERYISKNFLFLLQDGWSGLFQVASEEEKKSRREMRWWRNICNSKGLSGYHHTCIRVYSLYPSVEKRLHHRPQLYTYETFPSCVWVGWKFSVHGSLHSTRVSHINHTRCLYCFYIDFLLTSNINISSFSLSIWKFSSTQERKQN